MVPAAGLAVGSGPGSHRAAGAGHSWGRKGTVGAVVGHSLVEGDTGLAFRSLGYAGRSSLGGLAGSRCRRRRIGRLVGRAGNRPGTGVRTSLGGEVGRSPVVRRCIGALVGDSLVGGTLGIESSRAEVGNRRRIGSWGDIGCMGLTFLRMSTML